MKENDASQKRTRNIQIGVSGLWRFYDEGFTRWPEAKLAAAFSNMDLEHPELQKEFQELEKQGLIRLCKRGDCYLEVLCAPAE
jgi:hypothetical protein